MYQGITKIIFIKRFELAAIPVAPKICSLIQKINSTVKALIIPNKIAYTSLCFDKKDNYKFFDKYKILE